MKVYVYKDFDGEIRFYDEPKILVNYRCIGTEERNIVPEKKWVKKEFKAERWSRENDYIFQTNIKIPKDAQNITLSFEVPE